ncbi:pseudaminic acid biosynthesis-associated methylase [Citromicrobium bathyomarinum]|jgi:spore coat polysaccharide biosynthesis protein SpsF|uniref:pseudaminic acid biosynthesis-associated methylase n=1 Tax=Citromicrobium bathyomarinum TaxID=72174 RepID=UPI00315A951E
MSEKKTEQEEFWAGNFGDDYSDRNVGDDWIATNAALFSKILDRTRDVGSVLEFGANIGLNLRSLRTLLPKADLAGIEINAHAAAKLREWGGAEVIEGSILDLDLDRRFDLTLIKGVLIHINPDRLADVYERLYNYSSRYICVAEYYNPAPVTIPYRGHEDRLFKRDFAGEIMDRYPDLTLVDYGFVYRRDPNFPQDDITWFLLEKR